MSEEPLLRLTVEAIRHPDGSALFSICRIDRAVDPGTVTLGDLQYLIAALLPLAGPEPGGKGDCARTVHPVLHDECGNGTSSKESTS